MRTYHSEFNRNISNDRVIFIIVTILGIFAALPLFNQLPLSGNVSLLWIFGILFLFIIKITPRIDAFVIPFFLFGLAVRFAISDNTAFFIKYIVYSFFTAALLLTFSRRWMTAFVNGFSIGVSLNITFAIAQYIFITLGIGDLILPVSNWNPYLWHANPPGGMVTGLPRVSGFTNEPAYFGMLILCEMLFRIILGGRYISPFRIFFLTISCIFLVNSRTAFISVAYFMLLLAVSYVFNNSVKKYFFTINFFVSFAIIPVVLVLNVGKDYDVVNLMLDDISVFARTMPLLLWNEMNNLDLIDMLFGVGNYSDYIDASGIPSRVYEPFILQGGDLDSKSLGGAYLFDLGLVGTVAFAAIIMRSCRFNQKAFIIIATSNIAFFNVYAFSWPLYWILIAFTIISTRKN